MGKHIEIKSCPICTSQKFSKFKEVIDYTVSREIFQLNKCDNCGFVLTSPRPSDENISKYYKSENYISHSEISSGLKNRLYLFVRKIALAFKVKLVKRFIKPNDLVIDFGAGTGAFIHALKSNGILCKGYEPDSDARKKAELTKKIKLADTEEFYNQNEQASVITLWHVLEHIPDLSKFIDAASQNLTDNGRLIIAVPNRNSYDAKIYDKYWAAYDVPRHLWHFRKKDLEELFALHDFELIQTRTMLFDSFYISLLSEEYKTTRKFISFIKAFYNGLISNILAYKYGSSSQIYIFKKIG
jgi:SAM-dependent methyltransferase